MCGIAGLISQKPVPNLKKHLKDMATSIAHRGPDGEGLWENKTQTTGLAHRRLAIVDLSERGANPMSNEDGTVWIVYNGEIYNHMETRAELEKLGHVYRSKTDTETVIHAYEEWGEACVERFRGMFSFAIWDENKQELFFARDRIGERPFYYTMFEGAFYFGSEIKAILANPEIPREMDEEAFYHYLTFFVAPAPQTLFKDIKKLPPGHSGTLRKGNLKIKQYWDALSQEDTTTTPEQWQEEIRDGLQQSVKSLMMSDVPFGAYLSGGIDSSAITVLMNKLLNQPIRTFLATFKNHPDLDESKYATQIAETYHADHRVMNIDKNDFYTFYPKLLFHQDDPASDWVSFPLYFVSKLIHDQKVVVAQVGEGSDELFCGYTGYLQFAQLDKLYRPLSKLPKPLRQMIYGFSKVLYKIKPARFLPEFGRRLAAGEELFWGAAIAFTEFEKKSLLGPGFRNKYNSHKIVKAFYDKFDAHSPGRDQLARMTYLELKNRLAELLLMRVDRMGLASAVEARVPFLDYVFVERMLQLPSHLKTSGGTKTILKQALRGIIPDNIIDRKKMGFHAPISDWLRSDQKFQDFVHTKILDSSLITDKLIQSPYVERLFALHKAGQADCSVQIWCLLNVCGWHDYWIKGTSI